MPRSVPFAVVAIAGVSVFLVPPGLAQTKSQPGGAERSSDSAPARAPAAAPEPTSRVASVSANLALNEDEIKEIQRFLKVKADGKWGKASEFALQRWQRLQKVARSAEGPTREILERIRKK